MHKTKVEKVIALTEVVEKMLWGFFATIVWTLLTDPAKNTGEENTFQIKSADMVSA